MSGSLMNAWCGCCDTVANDTLHALLADGWEPTGSSEAWRCPLHALTPDLPASLGRPLPDGWDAATTLEHAQRPFPPIPATTGDEWRGRELEAAA